MRRKVHKSATTVSQSWVISAELDSCQACLGTSEKEMTFGLHREGWCNMWSIQRATDGYFLGQQCYNSGFIELTLEWGNDGVKQNEEGS